MFERTPPYLSLAYAFVSLLRRGREIGKDNVNGIFPMIVREKETSDKFQYLKLNEMVPKTKKSTDRRNED
jgi:hypothetical protein